MLYICLPIACYSQTKVAGEKENQYRIMFYNVENYFDAIYDSSLTYNEFTPDGNLHWTHSKYINKRNSIYKVIKAVGGWNPVTIIGLAEVENNFVISDLISNTPLVKEGYKIVHFESNDFRGIDVALLYKSTRFKLLHSEKVVISDPQNPDFTTRDILYVKGLLKHDTIHLFVNHWTSRYRGYLESEPYRLLASKILIKLTDSICTINSNANIVLMGDFNDNPDNKSLELITDSTLCGFDNLKPLGSKSGITGTLKYKGMWLNFDQFFVANSLIKGKNGLQCSSSSNIFDAEFLLEYDLQHLGMKTNRTNIGYKYHGGTSDHLPVYFDIISVK